MDVLRFRSHRIALIADISKMYRAIELHVPDRDLHRFLWRRDPKQTVEDYRMTRVTFGVSSSAFMANMAVKQNAIDFAHEYPWLLMLWKTPSTWTIVSLRPILSKKEFTYNLNYRAYSQKLTFCWGNGIPVNQLCLKTFLQSSVTSKHRSPSLTKMMCTPRHWALRGTQC